MTAPRPRAAPRAAPRPLAALSDLYRGELVGLRASIARSCNPGIVGASGTVVRETKNMLVLSTTEMRRSGRDGDCGARGGAGRAGGTLRGMRGPCRSYPKAGSVWRFKAGAGRGGAEPEEAEIDGSLIARRPEDRLRARLPAGHARRLGVGGGSP